MSDDTTDQWFLLQHEPGPALPDGTSIFGHPSFRDHFAFLQSLDEHGWLVAAGPIHPERGEGMAVVRVPAADLPVDMDEVAATEDACVAGGFLQATVTRWDVRLAGS